MTLKSLCYFFKCGFFLQENKAESGNYSADNNGQQLYFRRLTLVSLRVKTPDLGLAYGLLG